MYPLASRVELSEDAPRRSWRFGDDGVRTGYQSACEDLLGELYGLPRCDLQTRFDEVQIQHSPRYSYGEAVAVSDEQEAISDPLSLAHGYSRFTRALTAARLGVATGSRIRHAD